jgi:cytochrome P450
MADTTRATHTTTPDKLPVVDWATDFDHTDPVWVDNPFPIWDDLRKRCPVAHSERYTGVYLPTRHDDIAAIAYDTENFSSRSVVVSNVPNEYRAQAPIGGAPPITSDPPFHQHARRLLLPAFGPKVIEQLRPACVMLCDRLLDEMGDRAVVEGAVDYAQNIPTAVIAQMLGLPIEDQERFREFVHGVLGAVDAPVEERMAVFEGLIEYLKVHVEDHRANPREDLISFLLDAELFGEKLTDQHVFGTIILLLVAGIDTTWSAIGSAIYHLASNADDRNRLIREPELLPTAVEEFLRAYAPVTMARVVEKDVEINGTTLQAGQWCLLPFPAANRDPEQFERADEVIIDRAENRHSAFGLGIHRCLGSNLARLELTVALERWLARFPDFDLDDPNSVTWAPGQVRGPRVLPIRVIERA